MSFWEKVKYLVSWKHLLFGLIFLVGAVGLAFIDSADDVKVTFSEDTLIVASKHYEMQIGYDEIERVGIETLAERGEQISGTDNITLRTGNWKNEAWGEYYICADLDCTKCIVLYLTDGSTYVFSRLSNDETQSLYWQLVDYLPE